MLSYAGIIVFLSNIYFRVPTLGNNNLGSYMFRKGTSMFTNSSPEKFAKISKLDREN